MHESFWNKIHNMSDWSFGAFWLLASFLVVFTALLIGDAIIS